MYDTHCHLTFDMFTGPGEPDGVIARAREAGLRGMITVATTSANAEDSLALAEQFPDVWCSSGVHPLYADQPVDWSVIRAVAEHPRCVAWGELGLDNHYDKPPRPIQDRILTEQLALIESARSDGITKPVIVHCREAFADLVPILAASSIPGDQFVFHCFTAGPDEARLVLDLGAMISFTGVVTFQNAPEVRDAACLVPADRIMVETDAPFLTPKPHRKVWPNEPRYVIHIAEAIADARGIDRSEWESQLDQNAERFFNLPGN